MKLLDRDDFTPMETETKIEALGDQAVFVSFIYTINDYAIHLIN